ncbi:MAG: hypothetical protein AAGL18_04565 [Pseudomonadota bacterium]
MAQHLMDWLGLVVPALAFASSFAWLWRHWLRAGWLKFFVAYLGGMMTLGLTTIGVTILTARLLSAQRAHCEGGETPWTCYEIDIANAYPAMIGTISLGIFLVMIPALKGLSAVYPPLARLTQGTNHG